MISTRRSKLEPGVVFTTACYHPKNVGPEPFMTDSSEPAAGASNASNINFASFVLSLVHTAAVHFGDVADPNTGEHHPPNLPLAQQMIDILAMLEEKTRGNLSAEE